MAKNLRFGIVTYDAILSCMLAKNGFTGPVRVVEGDSGIRKAIFQGDMDLDRLTDFSGWRILRTRHKSLGVAIGSIGHVLATLAIVKENNLKPEDIAGVRIKLTLVEFRHTTALVKKYARNAESADHSSFYATAIAIKERTLSPESFRPQKFTDPVVLDLIEKITVEHDPSLAAFQKISEITTKDGRCFQKRVDVPHGLRSDPLTDRELEDKFKSMALTYMDEHQIQEIVRTVWDVAR